MCGARDGQPRRPDSGSGSCCRVWPHWSKSAMKSGNPTGSDGLICGCTQGHEPRKSWTSCAPRAKERGHHIRAKISRPYRERRREPPPKSPLVRRNLKIIAWNLNTLTSKREVVRCLAQAHKPDVLILTETGLRLTDHAFQVTDYNAFHRYAPENRQQRKGAGLTLLVHRKHRAEPARRIPPSPSTLWVELAPRKAGELPTLVGGVYLNPSLDRGTRARILRQIRQAPVDSRGQQRTQAVAAGDWNMSPQDMKKWFKYSHMKYIPIHRSVEYTYRRAERSAIRCSTLDHVVASTVLPGEKVKVLDVHESDHLPLSFKFGLLTIRPPPHGSPHNPLRELSGRDSYK